MSTCTAESSFSGMKSAANSFTKDHGRREIEFSCNSANEHKDGIDIDGIITVLRVHISAFA